MYRHVIFFLFAIVLSISAASAQINEYYLGVFSNEANTIKFTIGAYPHSISQSKRTDGSFYTSMRVAIINNEKAQPIIWSDYKIYVLLKDGSLFYNFLTNAAPESDFSCTYTVEPGVTHIQIFCFEKLYAYSEIEKVWLSLGDNKFLPLLKYIDNVDTKEIPANTGTTTPVKK